ncbi:hypothetical protein OAD19_05040 [Octadecabacter sp.]|nr:hypothetical protein [Octadecabacter sp.]
MRKATDTSSSGRTSIVWVWVFDPHPFLRNHNAMVCSDERTTSRCWPKTVIVPPLNDTCGSAVPVTNAIPTGGPDLHSFTMYSGKFVATGIIARIFSGILQAKKNEACAPRDRLVAKTRLLSMLTVEDVAAITLRK